MKDRVIALGFFDGVHLGHGALLQTVRLRAKETGLTPSAILFKTHPTQVVGKSAVPLINTVEERMMLMKKLYHIEDILELEFDTALSKMPWDIFVREVLSHKYRARHVVAGYDYRFGYKGEGNATKLSRLCGDLGIGCDIIDRIMLDNKTISSTMIRDLIARGEIEEAAHFLGHYHMICGTVQSGAQLGRTIGIPTMNQHFEEGVQVPHFGVYITRIHIGDTTYHGITNVGVRPTVSNEKIVKAETYILDYSGDLYNKMVCTEFIKYLREERRFESVEQLKKQISQDIACARQYI